MPLCPSTTSSGAAAPALPVADVPPDTSEAESVAGLMENRVLRRMAVAVVALLLASLASAAGDLLFASASPEH
jgi:hypothetical protein